MCQKKPEVIKGNVRSFGMYCIIRLVYGIGNSLVPWKGIGLLLHIYEMSMEAMNISISVLEIFL